MTIRIETGNFDAFFQAPFNAYGPDSLYVSPLRADLLRFVSHDKNPLFSGPDDISIFTAFQGEKPVGRLTAHVHNASNMKFDWRRAYFGFFDCTDDGDAASALLAAAETWAHTRGLDEIVGNINLTAMQQIGVVTDGFENAPYTDQVWNPPHIPRLLEENGYARDFPMATFEVDLTSCAPPAIGPKQQQVLDDPDYAFARISRWNVRERMEQARLLLNSAFAQNPMFVPVSADEYSFQAKDMVWIIDPRISALLTYKGDPVATILCIPDLNPFLKKIRSRPGPTMPWHFLRHRFANKRAVLIYSAVRADMQGKGINPVVLRHVILAMKKAGYKTLGNTWIADVNAASLAQKTKAGAHMLHRAHLYRKALT